MRLSVLKERRQGEARVAITPDTAKKFIALGLTVTVERDAGLGSGILDSAYVEAGATIVSTPAEALSGADIVLKVQAPLGAGEGEVDELALIPRGALLIGTLAVYADPGRPAAYAERGIDACSMELLPRITRAQSMDVLSSQANLSGYRAVIEASWAFRRGFPMMMTAAGTVPPASLFVLGAGVAGLQAIATARRLGARVSATDVRPAAKEEIKSLGATFVGVETDETKAAQTAGGYAKELSDDFRRRQAELMVETVKKQDIVICTALTMGRKAPVVITSDMVASMRSGSVIVDLAADAGGNCAATVPGEVITTPNGVTILGYRNWAARISDAASALYARNLLTFVSTFWDKAASRPNLKPEDEIVAGVQLTRGGQIVHESFRPKAAA